MSNSTMLDKCNYCGLRQVLPAETDSIFVDISALRKDGIIKQRFIKKAYASLGDTEESSSNHICLLSRPEWTDKEKSCPAWQFDVESLSKADYLSLHLNSQIHKLTVGLHRMTLVLVWLTIAIIVLTVYLAS